MAKAAMKTKNYQITKSEAVALFLACGYGQAKKWKDEDLGKKLDKFPKLMADLEKPPTDKKVKAKIKDILAAMKEGRELELIIDDDEEETKPAKGKGKAAPAKGKGKAKVEEDDEDDEDDEEEESDDDEDDEDDEEESDDEEEDDEEEDDEEEDDEDDEDDDDDEEEESSGPSLASIFDGFTKKKPLPHMVFFKKLKAAGVIGDKDSGYYMK